MDKQPQQHERHSNEDAAATAQRTLKLIQSGFDLLKRPDMSNLVPSVEGDVYKLHDLGTQTINALREAVREGRLEVLPWQNDHDDDEPLHEQTISTGAEIPSLLLFLSTEGNRDESIVRTDLRLYRPSSWPKPVLFHLSYSMYRDQDSPVARLNFTAAYNSTPGRRHTYYDGSSSLSRDHTVISVDVAEEPTLGFGQWAEGTPTPDDIKNLQSIQEDLQELAALAAK